MRLLKFLSIAIALSLQVSCVQEIALDDVAMRVSGSWAEVDEDMLTSHYVKFENGQYTSYTAPEKRYVHEGVITHSSAEDFEVKDKSRYSIEFGSLVLNNKTISIDTKGDYLILDGKKYTKMSGMDPARFFAIEFPKGSAVKTGYSETVINLPVTVKNESAKYPLKAVSNVSWISGIEYSDGTLSFTIDKSTSNRNGALTLSYFDAEDESVSVAQEVDRFLVFNTKEFNYGYSSKDYTISYSISNPKKDVLPTVTANKDWIKDIAVTNSTISFHLTENPSSSLSRTATLDVTYDEANPVRLTINQGAASTNMTVENTSYTATYKSAVLYIGYTITNPRDGISIAVSTVNDWITVQSTNNGKIKLGIAENSSGGDRVGSIKVSYGKTEHNVTISQSYSKPEFSCADAVNAVYSGESKSVPFTVSQARTGGSTNVTRSHSWISSPAVSGNGFTFNALPNTTGIDREGVITLKYSVGGKILAQKEIKVTQVAASLKVNKEDIPFNYASSSVSLGITADCAWTIESTAGWLSFSTKSGSESGTVSVTASANNTGADRATSFTVKNTTYNVSKTISVEQIAPYIKLSTTKLTPSYGTETSTVSVESNTNWTVTADSWINVTPSSGSGNGTVKLTPTKNESTTSRTGTVTVSSSAYGLSSVITVTQQAFSKSWTMDGLNTWNITMPDASSTSRRIRTNFPITVTSSEAWLTASHSTVQQGETELILYASNNDSGTDRNATLTLSNSKYGVSSTISVSQIAASISLSSDSWTPGYAQENKSISITSNIPWTATSDASWLTLDKTSASNGSTSLNLTAKANTVVSTRTATVTISNTTFKVSKTITVTQDAFEPQLSVSNSVWTADGTASSATFSISSNIDWTVSSDQIWLVADADSGSGNESLTLVVVENPSFIEQRTGTVTISNSNYNVSQKITVTQQPRIPVITLSSSSLTFDMKSQSSNITITSDANWTASSNQSWLTINKSSGGEGSTVMTLTAQMNASTSNRTAIVTISDVYGASSKTITITQYGYTTCAVSLSKQAVNLGVYLDKGATYTLVIKGWSSNGYTLFGIEASSDSNDWRFFKSGNYYYFDWGSSRISRYYSTSITGSYRKFVLSNYAMAYYSSESTSSYTWRSTGSAKSSVPSTTAPLMLGHKSESLTFKSLVVKNSGGTTTNNFIGVKSNNTVGIYDTVNKKLIVAGTYVSL